MRPSVWINPRNDRLFGGGLLLLALLLLPQAFADLFEPASPTSTKGEAFFVEVTRGEGETRVYGFEEAPRLSDLRALLEAEEASPRFWPGGDPLLASGDALVVHGDGTWATLHPRGMSAFHRLTLGLPVCLNETDAEGLTALPGIGPTLALRIVEERGRLGGFGDLDELLEVKGIGPATLAKIRPRLVL